MESLIGVNYAWVGLAGCLGALSRYWLGGFIAARFPTDFPLGTFAINVSGSLLVGLIATMGVDTNLVPANLRIALMAGFLGAYTTFSTWSLETLRLLESGSYLLAALNVAGSALAGLAGAWMGISLGRMFG